MDGTPDPVDVERIRPARSGRVGLDRHDVKIARYVDGPAMTNSQLSLRRVSGLHSQRLMPRRFHDVLASLEVATETKLQYHWEGYWYSRLEEVLFEVSGNAEIGTLSIEASFPSLAGHPIPDRVDGFLRVMDEIAPGSRQWATEVISSDEPDGIRSFGAFDAYVYEELPPLYDAPPTAEPRIHVELTSL